MVGDRRCRLFLRPDPVDGNHSQAGWADSHRAHQAGGHYGLRWHGKLSSVQCPAPGSGG